MCRPVNNVFRCCTPMHPCDVGEGDCDKGKGHCKAGLGMILNILLLPKAHPIKLCKTGNIRSNFKKLVTFGNLKVLPFQNSH